MFKGIQHVGFITNNLDKCFEFYSKFSGVKIVFEKHIEDGDVVKKITGYKNAKIRSFYIQIGGDDIKSQNDINADRLEFIEYIEPKGKQVKLENNSAGNAHVCLYTDSIEEDYKKIKEMGLYSSELVSIDYEVGGLKDVKNLYFRDPDGRTVELMQFPW